MKNLGLLSLLFTCIALQSCKNNQSEKIIKAKEAVEIVSVQCYKALYEEDTLDLKINTFKNGEITGNMEMAIANMPKKVGEIAGEFHGDTLFAYTEKTYKNPMAFLKRGNQLILGDGKIQITLGASHFVKGEPIDFERVKYKFTAVDCVDK
jgi:hypothetical protein